MSPNTDDLRSVQFDLRDVCFIDCYSAQVLICYVRSFDRAGALVSIKLPGQKPVRDMLRIWSFDDALMEAVGSRLSRYCDEDDRSHYFPPHEYQTTFDPKLFPTIYSPTNAPRDPADNDKAPRTNFFGFRTIRVPVQEGKRAIALAEKELWQSPQVARLLERDFGLDVRFVSARIIFEAVFNALRHSNADLVQTLRIPVTSTRQASYHSPQRARPIRSRRDLPRAPSSTTGTMEQPYLTSLTRTSPTALAAERSQQETTPRLIA